MTAHGSRFVTKATKITKITKDLVVFVFFVAFVTERWAWPVSVVVGESESAHRRRVLADILFSVAWPKKVSHCARIRSSFATWPLSTLRPLLTM